MLAKAACTLVLGVALVAPVAAQEATPGVIVSQQICDQSAIDNMNQMVQEYWAPVLDAAMDEGVLTAWGVLTHFWGDEWNWNIYYVGPNATTLVETVSGLLGEIIQGMPGDAMETFDGFCSRHKDNVYAAPVMRFAPPVEGGDSQ